MTFIPALTRRVVPCVALALALTLPGCADRRGEPRHVEKALDVFARDLAAAPLEPAALPARIRAYLGSNPYLFGSTVTIIGADGKAIVSPYVYRRGSRFLEKNLAEPAYDVDHQAWLAPARDSKAPIWTAPYFDAGGGEIWMITRSVPLVKDGVVYAVVTSDLRTRSPRYR